LTTKRAAVGLVTVALLAACSSGGASTPHVASGRASTPPAASGGSKGTHKLTATPMTLSELAAQLKAGAQGMTSEHITISESFGGQSGLNLEGDETLAAGRITAMRLEEKTGATTLSMRLVDGSLYMKLPASLSQGRRPWYKLPADSPDPVLRKLASSLRSIEQSASQRQGGFLAQSADSLITVAVEQSNRTKLTHYSILVDPTKVHSAAMTEGMKKVLAQAGVTKIPVDFWVDQHGRTVKVAERFTVQGEPVSIDISVTRINEPITIVAPPASQLPRLRDVTTV
jgi:hypothetical protein